MTTIAEAAITLPYKMLEGELLERFKEAATETDPQLTAAEREELGRVTHIGNGFLEQGPGARSRPSTTASCTDAPASPRSTCRR